MVVDLKCFVVAVEREVPGSVPKRPVSPLWAMPASGISSPNIDRRWLLI